ARATRGRKRPDPAPGPVRQGAPLRRARARRGGRGHRPPERRGAGAGRRTRCPLPGLQPRDRRRAPGGIAAQARHLSHRAERAVALYAAHADRRRPLRLEKPRRSGLGAGELRQEVPRRGTAAGGAGAVLQRRHGAPEPMYLLTAAMQDVVREGTAQGLKNFLPPELAVAGKTGTTDEQRDAWFAGFTGDRLGVVWIGYDDNRAARLTGAGVAVPVWG